MKLSPDRVLKQAIVGFLIHFQLKVNVRTCQTVALYKPLMVLFHCYLLINQQQVY